jgi:hypothetical protein
LRALVQLLFNARSLTASLMELQKHRDFAAQDLRHDWDRNVVDGLTSYPLQAIDSVTRTPDTNMIGVRSMRGCS